MYIVVNTETERFPVYRVQSPSGEIDPNGYSRQSDARKVADRLNEYADKEVDE